MDKEGDEHPADLERKKTLEARPTYRSYPSVLLPPDEKRYLSSLNKFG